MPKPTQRQWEHYCYTSQWVYECKCTVYNLNKDECVRLVKRCQLFKNKPTKIKFINDNQALFYYTRQF